MMGGIEGTGRFSQEVAQEQASLDGKWCVQVGVKVDVEVMIGGCEGEGFDGEL